MGAAEDTDKALPSHGRHSDHRLQHGTGQAIPLCSLFEIAGDACGLSDLDWPFTMYARAAEPALQDGKRADRGYTVTTGTQTKSHPVIGDIVITACNNKHWLSSPCVLCSRSQVALADLRPRLAIHFVRQGS